MTVVGRHTAFLNADTLLQISAADWNHRDLAAGHG